MSLLLPRSGDLNLGHYASVMSALHFTHCMISPALVCLLNQKWKRKKGMEENIVEAEAFWCLTDTKHSTSWPHFPYDGNGTILPPYEQTGKCSSVFPRPGRCQNTALWLQGAPHSQPAMGPKGLPFSQVQGEFLQLSRLFSWHTCQVFTWAKNLIMALEGPVLKLGVDVRHCPLWDHF